MQRAPLQPHRLRRGARLTGLRQLDAESVDILREAFAEAERHMMLYAMGKDSTAMLRLAIKPFFPSQVPFTLLHVDTTWKFRDMIVFRDDIAKSPRPALTVHVIPRRKRWTSTPFIHGAAVHAALWKTQALKQALERVWLRLRVRARPAGRAAIAAKERIFSCRSEHPLKPQDGAAGALWRLYNAHKDKSESIRVFPLSNWTEPDIRHYIRQEAERFISRSRFANSKSDRRSRKPTRAGPIGMTGLTTTTGIALIKASEASHP